MSSAAFLTNRWSRYRSAQAHWTNLAEHIDADCQSSNPPSAETIVELVLLGDSRYMRAMLHPTKIPSHQRGMNVGAISHDPTHPFYKKVRFAFNYANSRRKKAGLSLNKWPIPICSPLFPSPRSNSSPVRRLIWSLNRREVKAARGMFKCFMNDGLVPFRVGSNGQASKRVMSFDATLCEILFKPGDSK